MRTLRILGMVAAALAVPVVGVISYASWESAHKIYPSFKNESAFLRSYDPKVALMPFIYELQGYTEPGGIGGGSGTKFVSHFARYGEYFAIRADRRESLMAAVNDNVVQRLRLSGARILAQTGSPSSGFQFEYETGNTIGSVAIQPLVPGMVHRNLPLPEGFKDMSLRIEVREEWFPNGLPPGTDRLLPDGDR